MAAPYHVRIRSYNVGFGDCFLLTFTYPRGDMRNVLIDFGSTKRAARGPDDGLDAIAEKIREDSRGKLHMLVATHRHADHISGFAGKPGAVIRSLQPDLVVQPWTEDPGLDPSAPAPPAAAGEPSLRAQALVSRLSDMQSLAAAFVAEAPRLEESTEVPSTVAEQIRFLGETNIKNEPAVRNLMTMGQNRVYASFGTKLPTRSLLPQVRIDVLGPPTLKQSSAIADEAHVDADEFWHVAARRAQARLGAGRSTPRIFPSSPVARQVAQEARWLIPQVDKMRAEEMLAIVRVLDGALNNTSLILLFQIGDTALLFPGDAQLENWRYALRDADDAPEIRARLARVRFYKVGHHGSLNATPKTLLWKGFERRSDVPSPERLATMVSTSSGKHGSVGRGTEVPRKALIDELSLMSNLSNTQTLRSKREFWNDVELDL